MTDQKEPQDKKRGGGESEWGRGRKGKKVGVNL